MPRSLVLSSLVVTLSLLGSTSVPAAAGASALEPTARARPRLAIESAALAGLPLRLALEQAPATGASSVLLARVPGSPWARVVALAAPGEGFELALPRGCEGLELELWAEGSAGGERWCSTVQVVTVERVDLAGFDPSVDRFAVTGCSLGCSATGPNVSCSLVTAFQNADLRIDTSQPIELSSLLQNPSCVRIIDATTGGSPSGSFLLDPSDASVLIFRPQLSFDPLGNPSFGFEDGHSYLIDVRGQAGGSAPPYLLSVTGAPMASRMLCQITTQGLLDYVPGAPSVTLSPEGGATGVPLGAIVTMDFDDVMNLATLVIPATGQAPFITVQDSSGTPLAGGFTFSFDLNAKTTRVVFTPAQPLPPDETISVGLPAAITDLVGNPLANAGTYAFTTAGS